MRREWHVEKQKTSLSGKVTPLLFSQGRPNRHPGHSTHTYPTSVSSSWERALLSSPFPARTRHFCLRFSQPGQPPPHHPRPLVPGPALITFTGILQRPRAPAAPLGPLGQASLSVLIPKLVPALCLEPRPRSHCSQGSSVTWLSSSLCSHS